MDKHNELKTIINNVVTVERDKSNKHQNTKESLLLVGVVEFFESGKIQKVRIRDSVISIDASSNSCRNVKIISNEFSNKSNIYSSSSFPCLRQCLLIQLYREFINENELSINTSLIESNSQPPSFSNSSLKLSERNEYHLAANDTTSIIEVFDPISNRFVVLPIHTNNYHSENEMKKQFSKDLSAECSKGDFSLHSFGRRIRCRVSHFPSKNIKLENMKQTALMNIREKTEIRCIQGRFFPFDSAGIPYAGKTLKIEEKLNSGEVRTGLNVWDGSLLLGRYLEIHPEKIRSKRVLELGSGCGLVGIASAFLSAKHVTLTDLPYALPLMKENVQRNQIAIAKTSIHCQECDWSHATWKNTFPNEKDYFDVVLIADCVWLKCLVSPLLRIMQEVCGSNTRLIVSYQRRGKDAHDLFYNGLQNCFNVNEIDVGSSIDGRHLPDNFFLFEGQIKS